MPVPARRGRPPKTEVGLSRAAVLAAGMRLVEREGLDALTMRRLAAELGVRATSIYRYAANKDELVAALTDEVFVGLDLARYRDDDWRTSLRAMAHRLRDHLLARRDAARLVAGRFTSGPHALRAIDTLLGVLRSAGLSDRDAAYAVYMISTAILGYVAAEQTPVSPEVAAGMPARRYLSDIGEWLGTLPPADYPNVVDLAAELTGPDLDTRFDFLVDRLVASLAPLAGARAAD